MRRLRTPPVSASGMMDEWYGMVDEEKMNLKLWSLIDGQATFTVKSILR